MIRMLRKFVLLLIALPVLSGCASLTGGKYDLQHDMDIVRLNHLKEIGGYIEEYRAKIGYYPLANHTGGFAVVVHLVRPFNHLPDPHYMTGGSLLQLHPLTLARELERGLGRKVVLPFDPQWSSNRGIKYYAYVVEEGEYQLVAFTHQPYPFSTTSSKEGHWTVISSTDTTPDEPPLTYAALMSHSGFIEAAERPPHKPGYVEKMLAREREMLPTAPSGRQEVLLAALTGNFDGISDETLAAQAGKAVGCMFQIFCQPLHVAAAGQTEAVVAKLLTAGFDPNQVDGFLDTPLLSSAQNRNLEARGKIRARLLQSGADPNFGNAFGWTPMATFAREGAVDDMEAALAHSADVNHPGKALDQENKYRMPLTTAIRTDQTDAATWLLEHGADPRIPNGLGYDALDLLDTDRFPELGQQVSTAMKRPPAQAAEAEPGSGLLRLKVSGEKGGLGRFARALMGKSSGTGLDVDVLSVDGLSPDQLEKVKREESFRSAIRVPAGYHRLELKLQRNSATRGSFDFPWQDSILVHIREGGEYVLRATVSGRAVHISMLEVAEDEREVLSFVGLKPIIKGRVDWGSAILSGILGASFY